jgi:hypothetical protein
VLDHNVIGAGHVDEEDVVAVGDQKPGRVERARIDGGAEGVDGSGRRGMPGEGEGELPAGTLGGVGPVSQRPIGEPSDDSGLIGRQPCAAPDLVAPTEDRQFAAGALEAGHRDRRAGTAFVAVGGHDQRHPRDDPVDHDQQAHRWQRTRPSTIRQRAARVS